MEQWKELELEYGKRLRSSSRDERETLYSEAYSAVTQIRWANITCTDPEKRTAGASRALAEMLASLCRPDDKVLEVGCGRGYVCMMLAPHVKEIVGVDVSEPSLNEARQLMRNENIHNALISHVSGFELTKHFPPESFDIAISIDMYEHLHPEDGLQHLKDVYAILKPKGRYIVVTPNKIDGPHDITRDIHPDAKEAMGFHLNETTRRNLISQMQEVGFKRFQSVLPIRSKIPWLFDIRYPSWIDCPVEWLFKKIGIPGFLKRPLGYFLSIRLEAVK